MLSPGSFLLDRVWPTFCLGCRTSALAGGGESGTGLCRSCARRLESWIAADCCLRCGLPLPAAGRARQSCGSCRSVPPPWTGVFAGWWYRDPCDRIVQALKYRRWDFLGAPLAERLGEVLLRAGIRADGVVPVPSSMPRRLLRGFHPAQSIAGPLARRLGVRLVPALLRLDLSPPQVGRSFERRRRLRARFWVCLGRGWLHDRTVLLVDDVLTTGATATAAARALLGGGAREVLLAVAARTPLAEPGASPS